MGRARSSNRSGGRGQPPEYQNEVRDQLAIEAAILSRNTKESLLDEFIPPFANFNNLEMSRNTTSQASVQTKASISRSKRSNKHDKLDIASPYDPEDIASYKWAKLQAVDIAENHVQRSDSVKKNINPPTHAGFLRSDSVNSQNRHYSSAPISTEVSIDRGKRSQSRLPPNGLKTRNRSNSPGQESSRALSKSRNLHSAASSQEINMMVSKNEQNKKEDEKMKKYFDNKKYTFQSPSKLVTCRNFNIKARAIFEKRKMMPMTEFEGSRANSPSNLSPSLHHLEIFEAMDNVSSTRQLCFSTGVSAEADPFFDAGEEFSNNEESSENIINQSTNSRARRRKLLLMKRRKESAAKRLGTFRRIDPAEYINSILPDHEPVLNSVRLRLPTRRDVGFPGSTEYEIAQKEQEIAKEAQLEEISPRMIVLLNSDDLGSHPDFNIDKNIMDEKALPGMRFATRGLQSIKQNVSVVMNTVETRGLPRNVSKTNFFSIFAPPIDSTSSSTEIWRARPCSDRPVGMMHLLAIPLDVSFSAGNIEPLLCTLSLYCLPKKSDIVSCRGKISEDFIFPAGEWNDTLLAKAERILAQQFRMDANSSEKNLKKALFTYDPTALPGTDGKESLHIFLQVHKVAHFDANDIYVDKPKNNTSSQFMGFPKKGAMGNSTVDPTITEKRAMDTFDAFGTQFLTPLCFGILPLFSTSQDDLQWPRGESQTMQLFSYHTINESEKDFVERLASISQYLHDNPAMSGDITHSKSPDGESLDSKSSYESLAFTRTLSSDDVGRNRNYKSKKNSFRMKRNKKTKTNVSPRMNNIDVDGIKLVDGHATFFTSVLGSDLSQSLLQSPPFIDEARKDNCPRLLVDTSGECAIMVNPEQRSSSSRKRSNLIRLPPSNVPSGYSDSSEVREILYLPPSANQQIGSHGIHAYGAHCNFLYLYPRLIKKDAVDTLPSGHSYSVRIRLVKQVIDLNGNKTYKPQVAIYNPSLLGTPIVEAVYTKLPILSMLNRNSNDLNAGIYLRDEIKLKLPDVVDGTYSIEFSLYSVEVKCDMEDQRGVAQSFVAETLIPLSSNHGKEYAPLKKVSTIIPNGLHRIKLSNYQLHVQSRLFSNVHVSDPAVATFIRNFTENHHDAKGNFVSPSKILSNASREAVTQHFHALLYMHLRYFTNQGLLRFDFKSGKIIDTKSTSAVIEKMKSLMAILHIVKGDHSGKTRANCDQVVKKMFKSAFDGFDEEHFSNAKDITSKVTTYSSTRSIGTELSDESTNSNDQDGSNFNFNSKKDQDTNELNEHDVRISAIYPSSLRRTTLEDRDKRLQQVYSSLNSTAPLNRTAYGASKIDRMKAEAELYESREFISELVDDDETVVTAATWQSHARLVSSSMNSVSVSDQMQQKGTSNAHTKLNEQEPYGVTSVTTDGRGFLPETPLDKAKDFARRMNTVANVFFAPCVAPNIGVRRSPIRKNLRSSKRLREVNNADPRIEKLRAQVQKRSEKIKTSEGQGSDDDSDCRVRRKFAVFPDDSSQFKLKGVAANDPHEIKVSFNIDSRKPYLYEVVLAIWLHCSDSQRNGTGTETKGISTVDINPQTFLSNMDFILPLCLKSFILRCLGRGKNMDIVPTILLDLHHFKLLGSLIRHIAPSLVLQVNEAGTDSKEVDLQHTLFSSDHIIDFFVGLLAVVHPAQVSRLISIYFQNLKRCGDSASKRIRISHQLRLRAVERLASLPRFAALNFPCRYQNDDQFRPTDSTSWTNQSSNYNTVNGSPYLWTNVSAGPEDSIPKRGWLSDILLNESFEICLFSCEVIVSGKQNKVSKKKLSAIRQKIPLTEEQLLHHQSIAYHSITIAYEMILRKHATDIQFQNEDALARLAGMFLFPVINNTIRAVNCLSRMESTHKVRCIWVSAVVYVLQEAPELAIRKLFLALCNNTTQSTKSENLAVRFLEALKLCTSTFQVFESSMYTSRMSPWLVQESFNTISAASIVLVDECCDVLASRSSYDHRSLIESALELLLEIVSTPQSSVTLLRGLGAVSHVLNKVGADIFISACGDNLQNWGRMFFTLMNSTSLSVRSMAVDLTISLFGSVFEECGNIDGVTNIFVTVLPEVAAREIALYGVTEQLDCVGSIEKCMWPLRRAIADIEATDPLDDDRVDTSLLPFLKKFCRVCQATIDGVLIELRIGGDDFMIMGSKINNSSVALGSGQDNLHNFPPAWTFDADEESLFEVADFFSPETSPAQKLRWLFTLRRLHEFKGQWAEAAETLIVCARTAADAIPHISNVWRPSTFSEWNKSQQLCEFCHDFLEPALLQKTMDFGKGRDDPTVLPRPTITSLCKVLISVSKESVKLYEREGNMTSLAYSRLQEVLKIVMTVVEEQAAKSMRSAIRRGGKHQKQRFTEEIAALRKVSASVNELVTKFAERMSLIAGGQQENSIFMPSFANIFTKHNEDEKNNLYPGAVYVRIILVGTKSKRFEESTAIPTFLEWGSGHICRVPKKAVSIAINKAKGAGINSQEFVVQKICEAFAEPLVQALRQDLPSNELIEFSSEIPDRVKNNKTYIVVSPVISRDTNHQHGVQSKRFQVRKQGSGPQKLEHITDITVAKAFPCAISRQPSLVTAEFVSTAGSFF